MNWDWHWISWFKGTPFQWGEFKLNSGNPYKSYRFGPLLIRVFLRGANSRYRLALYSEVELPVGETVNQQKTIIANDNFASEDYALAA